MKHVLSCWASGIVRETCSIMKNIKLQFVGLYSACSPSKPLHDTYWQGNQTHSDISWHTNCLKIQLNFCSIRSGTGVGGTTSKCSTVQICTERNLGMKQHWAIKNSELHPFWRLTDTSRWTGQFLKQKADGWSSHWNFWPKCHLGWTYGPAQWHQQSTPTERQHTVLHCWVHCSITSGKSFLWDMQRGTIAWSYWCSCFTTVCGPLVCQIHSLQAKRVISIPINYYVQCCQGNWISFPQTCCGCRYKCTKWKEHWLEDPKYCLWTNGYKGIFHQPCSFLWPQAWRRKRPHIFFTEAGHFKIPAPEADNIQEEVQWVDCPCKQTISETHTHKDYTFQKSVKTKEPVYIFVQNS